MRDEAVRQRTVREVQAALAAVGFRVHGTIESPVRGPQGNVEFLVWARYAGPIA